MPPDEALKLGYFISGMICGGMFCVDMAAIWLWLSGHLRLGVAAVLFGTGALGIGAVIASGWAGIANPIPLVLHTWASAITSGFLLLPITFPTAYVCRRLVLKILEHEARAT